MSGIWIVTAGICTALVFGRFLPSVLSRFLPIERAAVAAPLASLSDFHGRQEMQPAPPSRAGELTKMLVPIFAVICVMIAVMTHPHPVPNSPITASSSAGSVESGSGVRNGIGTGSDHHADSEAALEDQVRILQSKIASLQKEQIRQAALVSSLKQETRTVSFSSLQELQTQTSITADGKEAVASGVAHPKPQVADNRNTSHGSAWKLFTPDGKPDNASTAYDLNLWPSATGSSPLNTRSSFLPKADPTALFLFQEDHRPEENWPRQYPWNYFTSSGNHHPGGIVWLSEPTCLPALPAATPRDVPCPSSYLGK